SDEVVEPGTAADQGPGGLDVPGAKRLGGRADVRGVAARRARGAVEQGVRDAAHRRYHDDLRGRAVLEHDLRGVGYPGGVGERRAAELVDMGGGAGGPGHGVRPARSRRPGGRRETRSEEHTSEL